MKKKPGKTEGQMPVDPPPPKQLLNKKAEEYLRESGTIEDFPNAEEVEEAEKIMENTRAGNKND